MRVIHARKRVFKEDHAFKSKMVLLVWILSILKWKSFGYEVVLYTDKITLEAIKKIGFDHLYDEINVDYLEDETTFKNIDTEAFWALPKLLALHREVCVLGNKALMADQDVVPMSDISRMWTNTDIAVWSNKEYTETYRVYPPLYKLSVPNNYRFPKWFTGKAQPLNTGILHIKDPKILDFYIKEVLKYCTNNKNTKNNSTCITMCNAEQRMIGEIVKYKDLTYSVMQPVNKGLFNRNGFHTHGYKARVKNSNGLMWHLNLLVMIKELDEEMFNKLLALKNFSQEDTYLKRYGYNFENIKELDIYKNKKEA